MPVRPSTSRLSFAVGMKTRRSLSDLRWAADDVIQPTEAAAAASPVLGLAAALFNGVWGGSNLVPSKYARLHGVRFVISFATGALVANALLVLVYLLLAKAWWKTPL